ncbi:MAG: glycoside hydrolase family 15 protein [Proteobacteria bacterium]|nr:glycoside hydrolase family 15 protein [Pseudomonadota bacterium]
MPLPIEDYALIGDGHTAALVGRDGSIDWMCAPRFDGGACFAALLGDEGNGRWQIAPAAEHWHSRRRYRDGTLILETEFRTDTGTVRVIDCMPRRGTRRDILRIVEGVQGTVTMQFELIVRFDYGQIVPWVRRDDGILLMTAGPDTLELRTPVRTHGERMTTLATFDVAAGARVPFLLSYRLSHQDPYPPLDPEEALAETEAGWRAWSGRCSYDGRWKTEVLRSLITLKALIFAPTGGIVAAPTTSLPEQWGGVRNWDYRYCWLRDATFTLNSLLLAGYTEEAVAWRLWLERAVAGRPGDLQTLYSVTGERRLDERELGWLAGYEGAAPVRIGNAATEQFQLDVYGEVMDMLHLARAVNLEPEPHVWQVQLELLDFLESHWHEPDEGIWEIRGERRHFTHSKVMAWVAFDRAVVSVEKFGMEGPVERWRAVRDEIHAQVCSAGFDAQRGCFVQHYGSTDLDASLLLLPLVGFLPADDPRVVATVDAIQRDLVVDGLVRRYPSESGVDGLPPGEGTFLPCSFWLADCLAVIGRRHDAETLFAQLLALANDVGLLSEEYDPRGGGRMLGNFPQALTHMALVNTARLLSLPQHQVTSRDRHAGHPAAVRHTSWWSAPHRRMRRPEA